MRTTHGENLTSKVIIRFRHKAGKNGQLFPQKSWSSGLLITSTTGLILASGPTHHLIPYEDILSLEDEGRFSLQDGPKDKLIPITHAGGIDLYLTLLGVPPLIKNVLTKKLYTSTISSYRSTYLLSDGKKIPFDFSTKDDAINIITRSMEPIEIRPEKILGVLRKEIENGILVTLNMDSMEDIKMILKRATGELVLKMLKFLTNENVPPLNEKQKKVLGLVTKDPITTEKLTSKLQLAQLEGSIILNELIFLNLIWFDHDTKTFITTAKGSSLLQSAAGPAL